MISWTKLLNSLSADNYRNIQPNCLAPSVVVFNITKQCNLECRHCYFDAKDTKGIAELKTQELKSFINDLSELKVPAIIFSGGEPLLRQDLFELAEFAKENNLKTSLSTNGTLITKQISQKIKDSGFSYVGVSLDGREDTHNSFRKNNNAFKSAVEGIKNCQELGIKTGVRFTLNKYNFKDLAFIFDFVEKELVSRLCIYHLVYSGRAGAEDDLSIVEKREALELIGVRARQLYIKNLDTELLTVDNHADGVWLYLQIKKENTVLADKILENLKASGGNSSGIKLAAIDSLGNVYPDQFWRRHSLGNIRQRNFSDIWFDKDNHFLQALRNRKSLLGGRCQNCNFLSICNGNFRARPEAVFGDPWAEDPACYLTNKEIYGEDKICSAVSGVGAYA